MKLIAVLLTVYNRKEKTLQCLEKLFTQQAGEGYKVEVYLTNDGCTDGTPEAVVTQYPSVHIIKGDGTLFWNRGMYLAWETAAKTKEYDFYLWLNDDTLLYSTAFTVLINTSKQLNHEAIVVGSTCSSVNLSVITYGGRTKDGLLINPTKGPQQCHHFNGNIVLIPQYVHHQVGMNDPIFRHALGDFDYGLRAAKFGIKSYLAPSILGACDLHQNLPTWCNPETPFIKRWKAFRTPLGQNPEEFLIFEKRHGSTARAIFHYFTNHLRVYFPRLWY